MIANGTGALVNKRNFRMHENASSMKVALQVRSIYTLIELGVLQIIPIE